MKPTDKFLAQVSLNFSVDGLKLVNDFFIVFSRFEGALKGSFVYVNKNGDAKPDWSKYERYLKDKFDPSRTDEIKDATQYILGNPPKIQTIDNQILGWRDRNFDKNTPDINRIGQHIRDIRNNLFHGSKFTSRYDPDISRDYRLISCCQIILNEWLNLSPDIETIFNSTIPQ